MGSNNGYKTGGAFGNCSGTAAAGAIMACSNELENQQLLNRHSLTMIPDDDVIVISHQHPNISTSAQQQQLSSSLHSVSPHYNPKEVTQVMFARNGHAKNRASMDHAPTAHRMIRQDVHPAGATPSHHFQAANYQQHPMVSGNAMGGVAVEGAYGRESQMLRAPALVVSGGVSSLSLVTSSDDPMVQRDLSPPNRASYEEAGSKSYGRKRSKKRPKACGVCGDRAKSFHFGGLSCDSCKAFFRRSVQNDAHVAFRCAYDSCCDINISTRKSCQFCRFKKCISIGMEKSWVMTEEERNALNQQRLEKKQQTKPTVSVAAAVPANNPSPPQQLHPMQQSPTMSTASSSSLSSTSFQEPSYAFQSTGKAGSTENKEQSALAFHESDYVADVDKMLDFMSFEEQSEIKSVVETYLHAYKEMPFHVSFEEGRRETLEIVEMFTTILRRFAYFAKLIPDFSDLDRADQGNLLRAAVLEMCLLRGAACFDTENNRWPSSTMESLKNCPQLRVEDMQRLVSRELFEMHITFILHMKRLRIDEPIAMLLIMTVLFSPERVPVENKTKVNQSQEKYLMLLKKYVAWKFGSTVGNRVYPQLLTKLSDLRQLNDFHTEFHLNLDSKEVNAIKKSLEELHLNPYHNWKIVPDSHQSTPQESRAISPSTISNLTESAGAGALSMPMMTQKLIQSFADRRIPTLLDDPYAIFETDMSMIRQVQQTLGSIFPPSGLAAAFGTNAPQMHPSADSDSTATRTAYDQLSTERSGGQCSPNNPRGYASSTDSAETQEGNDIPQSSSSRGYYSHSLGDSSSSSAYPDQTFQSGEYHADHFHKFLTRNGRSEHEVGSVIKELTPTAFLASEATINPGSQPTVLRKHSSGGSSLPGTSLSVIRTAPSRKGESSSRVILQHSSSVDAQLMRSVNCTTMSTNTGWHGGEVRTNDGSFLDGGSTSAITATTRVIPPSMQNDDGFSDE